MANSAHLKRLKELGLSTTYYRLKKNEERDVFTERIAKQLPRLLIKCESSVPIISTLYGVDPDLIKLVLQTNRSRKYKVPGVKKQKTLREFEVQGQALGAAREQTDSEVADLMKKKAMKGLKIDPTDKKVTRSNWPRDPQEKADTLYDFLMAALLDYGSDLVDIASAGSLPLWEVQDAIRLSASLQEQQSRGLSVQTGWAEHNMFRQARESNNPGAAKNVLENFSDGRWTNRQQVDVRNVGFEPPKEDEEQASILTLVSKKESE